MNIRAICGRIGGYTTRSRHNPKEYTVPGRRAYLKKFMPDDPELSDEEKERRGYAALHAHMASLNLLAIKAKQRSKAKSISRKEESQWRKIRA